ncbi:BTB And C-terminal Kelch [Popillia japonica]|uniref:BTB And C-terminal Kelch n=1 Tax=Popillia japonica TaxID=7064 RepID=A0AAW1NLE9_POPJA
MDTSEVSAVWATDLKEFLYNVVQHLFSSYFKQTKMVVVTREPETEPMLGDSGFDETISFTNSEQNSCREQAYRDLTSIMKAAPLQINSLQTCLNLLTTAISLQDITLVKRCIEYLNKNLNNENVLIVYSFLHKCQMPTMDPNQLQPSAPPLVEDEHLKGTNWVQTLIEDLRDNCLVIIDENADHLLKQPELLQLPYKDIYDIVTRDTLRVSSERVIYNVIYSWGLEECNRMTLSKHHLPEVLRQLRYAPRYGLMKRKEFKRKMEEILEEKDWRKIKFYLEEKAKNRRVDELPNKMSRPRLLTTDLKPTTKAQINARERLTRCERCIINVLTCWTAIFD